MSLPLGFDLFSGIYFCDNVEQLSLLLINAARFIHPNYRVMMHFHQFQVWEPRGWIDIPDVPRASQYVKEFRQTFRAKHYEVPGSAVEAFLDNEFCLPEVAARMDQGAALPQRVVFGQPSESGRDRHL